MATKIDMDWRPETYFPESPSRRQLLTKIQGQARREIAAKQLDEGGIRSLDTFMARPELPEEELGRWGGIHPWLMGGEYLPQYRDGEVEIARISLKSTTFDQQSIRAQRHGEQIRLSVEDEYATEYVLPYSLIKEPLTLGQLIDFVTAAHHPDADEVMIGGLVIGHWNYMETELRPHPSECVDFASIDSSVYPGLANYYARQGDTWIGERLVPYMIDLHGVDEDEWDNFTDGLNSEWTLETLSQLSTSEFSALFDNPQLTLQQLNSGKGVGHG